MKIQNVKGGYDFLPKEQKIREYINNIIIKNFKEYGFNSIETPILCYYDMLADKYDEKNDILKEIYRLTDQGNRSLGLRYDLTVPFAKFIALNKNNISFPFKRYEISKVFRDGPVRVGRDREFTQCDADVVGVKGQLIEAELLSLYVKTFKELGIDIYIKYNNRNLMNGLIVEAGICKELIPCVTTIIDKKEKISEIEFTNKLLELDLNMDNIKKLNSFLNMSLENLKSTFLNSNNIFIREGLTEIIELSKYLVAVGVNDACIFDLTLARGQNYYTGNVFEVYDKKQRIKGSIGAGGRYDKMIGNFISDGNEYPCVGISFGLSAIYEILKNNNDIILSSTDIYIIPIGQEIPSLNIANILRSKGLKVEIEMQDRKLKKSLAYANKQKVKYVVIIGDNEINNKKLIFKNMLNGNNFEIKLDNINELKKEDLLKKITT